MNQYRCETCTRKDPHGRGWCRYAYENVNPPNTVSIIAEFTARCGCTYHSEFICQGKKVMDLFVSLITSEMVYDDGDMYYKVNPEKYVEVLGRMVSGDE